MLKQHLQQKLLQKLSPQQIQVIRLLELPTMELEERIKHELEDNPALEEGREETDSDDNAGMGDDDFNADDNTDYSLGDYLTEDDIPDYKLKEKEGKIEKKEDVPFSIEESLVESLIEQLGLLELSEEDNQIAQYIVGNLDDDGYLRRDLESISDDLLFQVGIDAPIEKLAYLLTLIQDLEPAGVGARDLRECLLLQLNKREQTKTTQLAIRLLDEYFEEFSKKHYDRIIKGLDISEEELKKILKEITTLNPKPGSVWGDAMESTLNIVIPDFIVESSNGELYLSMNNQNIPDLKVNREYREMLEDYTSTKENQHSEMKDAVSFVKQKLDSAKWFIDAIKQRQETLQRTMEAIIQMQQEFFLTGNEAALKPMILKDVAERTGYDISTISRVSNSKYVQTNFGVYPLKYFFSESMQNEEGEEVSTREIKAILREQIDAEDKQHPLTDEELAAILKQKGYPIARRTVSKYREQLGVSVARLRKEI